MRISFTKMHGLGNDFVVVQAGDMPLPSAAAIRALADRKTGIGFDQLLWLEAPRSPGTALYYRIFNTDGSEAEQCGNGARCIARLVAPNHGDMLVLGHRGGSSRARIEDDGLVSVEIAVPEFAPGRIPFIAGAAADSYVVQAAGEDIELRVVSLGNPHAVIRVDDVDTAPVAKLGPLLERHERFPNRANIGFMQVLDPGHIRLRVFERGVGETRACGTGACAAAVVGRQAGWLAPRVHVDLPGGELLVRWEGPGAAVWLTGEAIRVFEGTADL